MEIDAALCLVSDVTRNNFCRRKLVVTIPVIHKPGSIRRHSIEMEVWIRSKTLRLLIVASRMRITARKPAPRSEHLICLPPVDDHFWLRLSECFQYAPPAPPVTIATAPGEVEEG